MSAATESNGNRAGSQAWQATLELIRAQQWDAAEPQLRELHEKHPETALYSLYLERIAHYRAYPPGADWDGVTTFETK